MILDRRPTSLCDAGEEDGEESSPPSRWESGELAHEMVVEWFDHQPTIPPTNSRRWCPDRRDLHPHRGVVCPHPPALVGQRDQVRRRRAL